MISQFDKTFLDNLKQQAKTSSRLRSHHLQHKDHCEPVQRIVIALARGTFVKPHHHPEQFEWMQIIEGQVLLVEFDSDGVIKEKLILNSEGDLRLVESNPGTWHGLIPLTETAVITEVKAGPFTAPKPELFAPWAPNEGDNNCQTFNQWLEHAKLDDSFSSR